MGCKVNLGSEDKTPLVMESPFQNASDIKIPTDFLHNGRIPVVLEALKKLKEKYGDTLPIIVGITGPFTLTGHLLGVEKMVRYMRTKPYEIESALDKALDVSMEYVNALSEIGPDIICVAEPTSATELINPLQFKTIVKPRLEDLSREINTKKVLHICGSAEPILKDMASIGYDGLSVEEKVDVKWAKEELKGGGKIMRVGGRIMTMGGEKSPKLIGNISSSQTLFRDSPDEVKKKVKDVLESGIDILAPSCGLAPRSPLENIKAMVKGRNEFYK
jgi:[methyl-Co(III) methanol-specific corrinoid protein]:coenzyme M methyltransferase